MQAMRHRPPGVTWGFGGRGLLPFAAGAAGAWSTGGLPRALMQIGLLAYGALILSFLGGGRWGMEVGRPSVRPAMIAGAMAGAVLSTLLLAAVPVPPTWRLLVLAAAHLGQWAWDVRSTDVPPWYPRLRHGLTTGAVLSLLLGAAASLRG